MSSLLNAGDRFKCNDENGRLGKIEACSYNSMFGEWEYYARWDHIPHSVYQYAVNDVKDIWEKINEIKDSVNTGSMTDSVEPSTDKKYVNPLYCNHKWIDIGFRFSKIICAHCDTEKS